MNHPCKRKPNCYYIPILITEGVETKGQPTCYCGWSYHKAFLFRKNCFAWYLFKHRGWYFDTASEQAYALYGDVKFEVP